MTDEQRLTPMLTQYRQIKARFPDAIVLFRLGDFYETFDADAKIAARELELVLTSRSFAKGTRLPMAGVPHHHVQAYIAKLIDKGYKVALVEQLEDPKKVKRLVKRDVIRVITPGAVVEDALLRAKSDNYLAAIVRDVGAQHASPLLQQLHDDLDELQDVKELIDRAIVDDPPIFIKEGGLIKPDYDATLDGLRANATHGKTRLTELEEKERKRTGIKSLRVRYNEVFGFFIELPRRDAHLVPKNYERRATISHAERYVTPELKSQEAQILTTQDRVKDLEYELFVQVRRQVAEHAARLQTAARILAQLDALSTLAEVAARYGYVKPIVDDGDTIEIHEGRHPVVERFLRDDETFVPNDARLDSESTRVVILTGPNMSGKSVFVRQVALIVLMAQIGSFVPANFARIGLTDRIFTRVGASDDIAQGRSTFLVEMSETSHILRHATPRSLIVLDEVGRGTSTYDGISLAWAIAEEIHNIVGAKTLFAKHYHELTQLESAFADGSIKNFTMAVKEQGHEVIFLRQVIPGGAEKSFGIHVARLAGLPERVVERAEDVLTRLESERETKDEGPLRETEDRGPKTEASLTPSSVIGLPSVSREDRVVYDARVEMWREVLRQIADVDIANITPVQALNLLNEMQVKIKSYSQVSE